MNFSTQWPLLFSSNSTTNGATTALDPSLRLKVLYSKRKQALLVPLDVPLAHQAVNFFIHKPIFKYWGHICIELDHYFPWLNLLPTAEFDHFPLNTLFGVSALDTANQLQGIAIFCGFPGPLQKLTIYCPDGSGGLGKVAKVAVHASADAAVQKETHWLEKLSHYTATAKFLPQLLSHGALECKRHFLTMTALPDGVSPKNFGNAHHAFLRALAQQKPVFTEWKHSEAHVRLKQRINSLATVVDDEVWLFWQEVTTQIEQLTAGQILPNLMVHGDFAPWNLRQIDAELMVFDWEYAQTYGNPVQDFLHFHLITQALSRGNLNHKFMSGLMQKTSAYVDKQYGKDLGVAKAAGALTLHYLLDTITFYALSSGYLDEQHPVLRSYIFMLQQRAMWLPKLATSENTQQLELPNFDNELELTS